MTDNVRHPAKYSKGFAAEFSAILADAPNVIDVFGGVGGIGDVKKHGYRGVVYCNELQPGWAAQAVDKCDVVTCCDSANLPFLDNYFYSACTSPVYGNRCSDDHKARDSSRRNTYTHAYGEPLAEGNTGVLQFTGRRKSSLKYCTKHKAIYVELRRVLKDRALLIINNSDHIRDGKRVRTTMWHILALKSLGFELLEHRKVATKRNRFGSNAEKRVEYESILIFRLHKEA